MTAMATQLQSTPSSAVTCYHCDNLVPPESRFFVEVSSKQEQVCCIGCEVVAMSIIRNGLSDYYRLRNRIPQRPDQDADSLETMYKVFDDPDMQRSFVRVLQGDVHEASLMLDGIRCGACTWLIEQQLQRLAGVCFVVVNTTARRAIVQWDNAAIQMSDVLRAISDVGYRVYPFEPHRRETLIQQARKQALRRVVIAGVGMMQVMMYAVATYFANGDMTPDIEQLMRLASLALTLPVMFYSAQPFFAGAWRELRVRRLGMDTPVALGLGAAFLASLWATLCQQGLVYFDSITMFVFLLLMGRYWESQVRNRASAQIDAISRRLPALCIRLPAFPDRTRIEETSALSLKANDFALIKPGDTVPADGVIVDGASEIAEALLTGESLPVAKKIGDPVSAGAVNLTNPLILRVERAGPDTTISTIVRLCDRAAGEKPQLAQLADRIAGWFVYALLILAALVGAIWMVLAPDRVLMIVTALLIVSCPCALSLATPTALAAATGTLARRGLLITRGHALESLARATHVVFDKTGTLTEGKMRLIEIIPLGIQSREECLAIARVLQHGSQHPTAHAICAGQEDGRILYDVAKLRTVAGQGIEGIVNGRRYRIGSTAFVADLQGKSQLNRPTTAPDDATCVLLGEADRCLAWFLLTDSLRPGAANLVSSLLRRGKQVAILSGDSDQPVSAIARRMGISQFHANMAPEQKLAHVQLLQRNGAMVVVVGDGINDGPVLATADLSVALADGTELAQIHADVVLMSDNFAPLLTGFVLAQKTMRIVVQNLSWAFFYNLTAIPLAAFGFVTPWVAAIGMSASSLLVILNALRLAEYRTVASKSSGGMSAILETA